MKNKQIHNPCMYYCTDLYRYRYDILYKVICSIYIKIEMEIKGMMGLDQVFPFFSFLVFTNY